jgi:hypothetical protein
MNIEYALIIDVSTQWFAYLVKYKNTNGHKEELLYHHIPSRLDRDNPFIGNIYRRKLSFSYERFDIDHQEYYGWHLSDLEYNKIKRMIDIYPTVMEFERLKKYE